MCFFKKIRFLIVFFGLYIVFNNVSAAFNNNNINRQNYNYKQKRTVFSSKKLQKKINQDELYRSKNFIRKNKYKNVFNGLHPSNRKKMLGLLIATILISSIATSFGNQIQASNSLNNNKEKRSNVVQTKAFINSYKNFDQNLEKTLKENLIKEFNLVEKQFKNCSNVSFLIDPFEPYNPKSTPEERYCSTERKFDEAFDFLSNACGNANNYRACSAEKIFKKVFELFKKMYIAHAVIKNVDKKTFSYMFANVISDDYSYKLHNLFVKELNNTNNTSQKKILLGEEFEKYDEDVCKFFLGMCSNLSSYYGGLKSSLVGTYSHESNTITYDHMTGSSDCFIKSTMIHERQHSITAPVNAKIIDFLFEEFYKNKEKAEIYKTFHSRTQELLSMLSESLLVLKNQIDFKSYTFLLSHPVDVNDDLDSIYPTDSEILSIRLFAETVGVLRDWRAELLDCIRALYTSNLKNEFD